jgi:hypothetical protein
VPAVRPKRCQPGLTVRVHQRHVNTRKAAANRARAKRGRAKRVAGGLPRRGKGGGTPPKQSAGRPKHRNELDNGMMRGAPFERARFQPNGNSRLPFAARVRNRSRACATLQTLHLCERQRSWSHRQFRSPLLHLAPPAKGKRRQKKKKKISMRRNDHYVVAPCAGHTSWPGL